MSSNAGGWPPGYGLHRLTETDSTNAEAARLAASSAGSTWITALRQTAGRGRRGRAWSTPEGALAATLLLRPSEPAHIAALRSFVASLALADGFEEIGIKHDAIGLKWPNDVLVYGAKAAGILLESSGQSDKLDHLAIGVGINLSDAPDPSLIEPSSTPPITIAQALGRAVDRDDMLLALARGYAKWEAEFQSHGFEPIRDAWLSRAARLGQAIKARTTRETFEGVFDTVDNSGNLVLMTAQGSCRIAAADVFF